MTIRGVTVSFACRLENAYVVDLDTAKHLKKCGFDKPTHHYWLDKDLPYVAKGLKRVKQGKKRMNHNKYESHYSAPTKDELMQWTNLL